MYILDFSGKSLFKDISNIKIFLLILNRKSSWKYEVILNIVAECYVELRVQIPGILF